MYFNKSFECYYNNENDIYLINYNKSFKKTSTFRFLISYVFIITFFCCILQICKNNNYSIQIISPDEDNTSVSSLPEYTDEIPPTYDQDL